MARPFGSLQAQRLRMLVEFRIGFNRRARQVRGTVKVLYIHPGGKGGGGGSNQKK